LVIGRTTTSRYQLRKTPFRAGGLSACPKKKIFKDPCPDFFKDYTLLFPSTFTDIRLPCTGALHVFIIHWNKIQIVIHLM
jgi:hypothetical protein